MSGYPQKYNVPGITAPEKAECLSQESSAVKAPHPGVERYSFSPFFFLPPTHFALFFRPWIVGLLSQIVGAILITILVPEILTVWEASLAVFPGDGSE